METLIKFWRKFDPNGVQHIHQDDLLHLQNIDKIHFNTFNEYWNDATNLFERNKHIHTGLLPGPYGGDLMNAKIYLLLLNPGFSHNDYFSECQEDVKRAIINNLRQENLNRDYPFICLNPSLCHTAGGNYWLKKFDSIIKSLRERNDLTYTECLKLISQKTCVLELFPYHSRNFGISQRVLNNLPSVRNIKDSLARLINERPEVLIICMRKPESWGIMTLAENVFILPSESRQNASLSIKSEAGKLIYDKLIKN